MKIFLIGFMGSGKTTVGKKLAHLMNYEFIDMDHFIEEEEGQSISQIFELKGEGYFRSLETKILYNLFQKENVVIATGGGAPCFNDNMKLLNESSITVYLKLDPNAFVSRVYDPNTNRPLLKGKSKEELQKYATEMLTIREPYYGQAKITIDAIGKGPSEIAERIKDLLQEPKLGNKNRPQD